MSLCTALSVSAQEICNNGIDDDGDGIIDFDDGECECASTVECTNVVPLTEVTGNPCRRVDLILEVPGATSYQWFKNGVALENETDSEIEIHKFFPLGDGCYQVVVETPTGCVASEPYKVQAEEFFEDLGDLNICEGDTIIIGGFEFFTEGKQQFKTSTSEGCDSLVCLNIVFVDFTNKVVDLDLCEGATFVSECGSITTTTDLMLIDTIRAVAGCDSIITSYDIRFSSLETQFLENSICFGDTLFFRGAVLTETGTHTVMSQDPVFGCDSTFVIDLDVKSEIRTDLPASICQGRVFELEDLSVSEAGSYDIMYESAEGCDSIVTVILEVDPPIAETIEGTFCRGQIFERGDFSTDLAGTFTHESSLGECDSIITFIIEESNVEERIEAMEVCEGGSIQWRGMTLSEEGRFEDTETNAGECDVLHVLELTLTAPEPIAEQASICEGLEFEWRGMTISEPGTYTDIVETLGECTEIFQLELVDIPPDVISEAVTICAGEVFEDFGIKEDSTGVYMGLVQVAGQCDEVYEVTLTVLDEVVGDTSAMLCPGETFELFDLSTTELGSHIATTNSSMGCDSTIMVELTAGFLPEMTRVEEICEGDVFIFQGEELTEERLYTFIVESLNEGCDTSLIIDLRFSSEIEVNENVSICEGEVYERHDLVLTETGTFSTMFVDPDGCDSLITVNLIVNPVTDTSLNAFICEGDSYEIEGEVYTEPGTYTIVTNNFAECDSTINVTLDFYPEIEPIEFDAEICEGEVYIFEDIEADTSGTYMTSVPSFTTGCDSTIIIHLDVLPLNEREEFVEICPGDIVTFFGNELTETGVYTERFSNVFGCDSVVTLVLDFDSELGDFQLEEQVSLTIGEELIIEPTDVDENFVSFHWFNEAGDIVSTSRELDGFTPLEDTFFELEAVSVNGCEVVKRVRVDVELIVDIYVPNVIRLGEDDADALFTVGANASVVGIQELRILDRWGETVFVDSHEGNLDSYLGWNGRFRGKEVQPAVFAYFIIFEIIDGTTVNKKGSLTVLK